MCNPINISSDNNFTIKHLSEIIKEVDGFEGEIKFDSTKPDTIYRKLSDNQIINSFNFKPEVNFKNRLTKSYELYLKIYEKF